MLLLRKGKSADMTKHATVHMELSKLTKGAVQYKEPGMDDNPMVYLIGTLYLRKNGLIHEGLTDGQESTGGVRTEFPAHIKVTIEVAE